MTKIAPYTLNVFNIAELREQAKRRLPRGLFEFVDRGAEDEVALKNNRAAIETIKLKPRILNDISVRSMETTVLGVKQAMPLVIAPTGAAGLVAYEGELQLAKAARTAGIPFTIATPSLTAMERIKEGAGGRLWFQLYPVADPEIVHGMVERVKSVGFEALVVTLDSKIASKREYNIRNGFDVPLKLTPKNVLDVAMHPGWAWNVLAKYYRNGGPPQYRNFPGQARRSVWTAQSARAMSPSGNFDSEAVRRLRKQWPGKLMIKGVLSGEDAKQAIALGCDGVVVSNHGGRVIDSAPATITVLPEIVDAVNGRATVLVDSGFRRGSDVVKALAIGADAVQVGRATLYGLGAAGEAGAFRALDLLGEEIDRVMGQIGVSTIDQINRDHLIDMPGGWPANR